MPARLMPRGKGPARKSKLDTKLGGQTTAPKHSPRLSEDGLKDAGALQQQLILEVLL